MSTLFDQAKILTLDNGCMGCGKYFTCKDENKGAGWSCRKFISIHESHTDDLVEQVKAVVDLNSTSRLQFVDSPEEIENFETMIRASLDQNRFLPLDLSVDDSEFPEAANYFEWTFGGHIRFRPFARQMWIALRLFAELCPHCSDPKWYHDIEAFPVDFPTVNLRERLCVMDHGKCPECGRGRAEMFLSGHLQIPQELACCVGQRGGKSIQTAGLITYHLHKLLKTVRPSEYYGLASSTTLTHTCTALQFKRAYSVLWSPIRDTIIDSKWFQDYHSFLTHKGERLGQELVVIKDTFINWRRSRLTAAPMAPNVGTLRGDTRVGAAIDELGLFRFGEGADDYVTVSADEIHASLTNSLATIRTAASRMIRAGENSVMQGLMYNISSPISIFDKIMTLVRAAKKSRVILGIHLPTWGMTPLVTRQDLQIYWDTDPIKAERDFGANPPVADNPFFGNVDLLKSLFKGSPNRVRYALKSKPGNEFERGISITDTMPLSKMPPSLLTIDAGEVNNSFALSLSIPVLKGRITDRPKTNSQGFVTKPGRQVPVPAVNINAEQGSEHRCIVLACIEVIPPVAGRINFNQLFNKGILPLLKPFNVQVVVADRWNSIFMLDKLHDEHHVQTFQYSLKYADFVAIKSYMEGGLVSLPSLEADSFDTVATFDQQAYPFCFERRPMDHLALQLMTVQDGTRTVIKGPNLTDDTFRTVALAVHYLRNAQFVKDYLSGSMLSSGRGGGLVASPSGEASVSTVVSLTHNSSRALVAVGSSSGEGGSTFARTSGR